MSSIDFLATDPLIAFDATRALATLQRARCDDNWLRQVAAQSYWHENGFLKIVLQRNDDGPALRLHLWSGSNSDRGNIHNHCWDFESHVLLGSLAFEEYRTDDRGPILRRHYRYETDGRAGLDVLTEGEAIRLRLVRSGFRVAGERYRMVGHALHRTWAASGSSTATFVVQSPRRRKVADVFPETGRDPAGSRLPSSPLQLQEALDRLMAQIER
jgi:hypothetical protein